MRFKSIVEGTQQDNWVPLLLKVDHSFWTVNDHPHLRLIKIIHNGNEEGDSVIRVLADPAFVQMISHNGKVFTMGKRLELLKKER